MNTLSLFTKPRLVVSVICFLFFQILFSQESSFAEDNKKQGFTIIEQSHIRLLINYSVKKINGINFIGSSLSFPGAGLNMPTFNTMLAIPNGSKVLVNVIPTKQISYTDIVSVSDPYTIRGVEIVTLEINPSYLNQVRNELKRDINFDIEVKFKGGNGQYGEDRLRNKWWDSIFKNMLLNYESLPKTGNNLLCKEDGAEYLIISPNLPVFQQWADSIKNFRTTQGILTKVATLDEIGGSTAFQVENYINDAYNNWDTPPVAILLLGDEGSNPTNSIAVPIWENYCISDNIYADVNGDDLPDIILARICAESAWQLEEMVTRFINYESDPPTNPDFYNHPITSCNFEGYYPLLTESVAGFYENVLGKSTNRINVGPDPLPEEWGTGPYVDDIVQDFGPDGLGYIPATPGEVNCSWNSSTQDVIDGINNGAFMLLHGSSGYVNGWNEPPFTTNNTNSLTNDDPTFIWSIGGATGKFDAWTECLAEGFHRSNHGALGIIAGSDIAYTFTNEIYTWGAWDFMWPEFLPEQGQTFAVEGVYPAFANAAGKYYLLYSPWYNNSMAKTLAYYLLHYFGDAFSTVYSEVPQELSVTHASWILEGVTTFEVSANEGSLIGLSVNGELIGKAIGTGNPISIDISPQYPPDEILVTVTKQNYYRYEAIVPVGTETGLPDNLSLDKISIYPNPSSGQFTIKFDNNIGLIDIAVTDLLGEVIFNRFTETVDGEPLNIILGEYPKGIYFVKLRTNKSEHIKKIIIQ